MLSISTSFLKLNSIKAWFSQLHAFQKYLILSAFMLAQCGIYGFIFYWLGVLFDINSFINLIIYNRPLHLLSLLPVFCCHGLINGRLIIQLSQQYSLNTFYLLFMLILSTFLAVFFFDVRVITFIHLFILT
jgi:hypothetical protein